MFKPGGLLAYFVALTDLAPTAQIETVAGAPGALADDYGDLFAPGVIARTPGPTRRKVAWWHQVVDGNIGAPVAAWADKTAENVDAAGMITSLQFTITAVPALGPGEALNGYLYVTIPNLQNVGL
jgi:hypothetical protein